MVYHGGVIFVVASAACLLGCTMQPCIVFDNMAHPLQQSSEQSIGQLACLGSTSCLMMSSSSVFKLHTVVAIQSHS
jgi:hypothetical protein